MSPSGCRHRTSSTLRTTCLSVLVAMALGLNANAQPAPGPAQYEVPAGELVRALNQISRTSGMQIVYDFALVRGKQATEIKGAMTLEQALDHALEGTGLRWERVNATTVSIQAGQVPAPRAARPATREAAAGPGQGGGASAGPDMLDVVTVTGSRIRGAETPSPTIVIDAGSIAQQGFSDLGELIRSLPQNFNGGQNPGAMNVSASLGDIANGNLTGGSGLNLRGLGPDATLTLLNGRRMAYGGMAQSVDISAIPVEAVDRIEIVADGSSAIYGSDAVAGVGNVILKRDFEGVTVATRYGDAANGGMTAREYSLTGGAVWDTGGFIATYKDSSVDPIYADQRRYAANLPNPYSIYPGIDQRSGLLSLHQALGDAIEVKLDALRTERDQVYDASYTSIYYHYTPSTTTSLISPSIEYMLPNGWLLSLGGTRGKDQTDNDARVITVSTGASTPAINTVYANESRSYEFGAEGPLFTLAGGQARLAVGAGYRTNDIAIKARISGRTIADNGESSRFAYAELNVPLLGPAPGATSGQRLALTAAIRGEDYDSFGGVTTPRLGLVYAPTGDVTFKASWGKSFKAPTLYQRYGLQYAYLGRPGTYGGTGYPAQATLLSTIGGNPDLGPERARTWSASVAFHPEAVPGLETELTWFDIDYTDRVVQPIVNTAEALSNPAYAEFVVYAPTAQQLADIIAGSVFSNYTGAAYDPANVVAMFSNTYVNAARQRIRGMDLTASYALDLGPGRLNLRGSASWLDSAQKTSAAQPSHDLAGNIYNPAKLNARAGAIWTQGGFSASTFANYTGGVRENFWSSGTARKTASFTTVDATVQYRTGGQLGLLSDMELSLSAQNLFNRDPSLFAYTSPYVPRYDATNTSVIGRYVSVSVSKHW